MRPLMESLMFLLMIGTFVGMIAIGAWILLPVDRAAKDRHAAVQFSLLDFLCLFVVVQLPTGIIRSIGSDDNERRIWFMYAFAWIACGLMWGVSVRRLSLAGVHRPWHRAVFQAAVLPVAYFGVIAGLAAVAAFFTALDAADHLELAGWATVLLALLTAQYLCGRFTRRIVAAASAPTDTAESQQDVLGVVSNGRRHNM